MIQKRNISLFVTLLCAFFLSGCSTSGNSFDESALSEMSPETMYEQANVALEDKSYEEATRLFEELLWL